MLLLQGELSAKPLHTRQKRAGTRLIVFPSPTAARSMPATPCAARTAAWRHAASTWPSCATSTAMPRGTPLAEEYRLIAGKLALRPAGHLSASTASWSHRSSAQGQYNLRFPTRPPTATTCLPHSAIDLGLDNASLESRLSIGVSTPLTRTQRTKKKLPVHSKKITKSRAQSG